MVQLPETGLLRLKDVLAVFPVSRSTWYAGIATHKYPRPVKLSERSVAWDVNSIRKLIDSAIETGGAL